ncbi:hypothetical protein [Burkholderia multivorans]|uniref:hypothetical protein n=1 Tax=Burkholderia multivorans TaxID=87883 RepID=UPI001C242B4A|nr:hypothetical protein [Burkholderia multivorans]MBU9165136.1 hypothetical protein [Burkholderia multivorans]MBU9546821.1 hypothetical protein [Burkholderia multivorans]MCA8178317.1 hypothetical protein [Burkholderia multivorans]
MRTSTGFHHDGACVKSGEKLDELLAAHLLAKHRPTELILTVEVKRVFAQSIPTSVTLCMMGLQKKTPYSVTRM